VEVGPLPDRLGISTTATRGRQARASYVFELLRDKGEQKHPSEVFYFLLTSGDPRPKPVGLASLMNPGMTSPGRDTCVFAETAEVLVNGLSPLVR